MKYVHSSFVIVSFISGESERNLEWNKHNGEPLIADE